ncbi:MAG: DNA polymerase/3'-5' exonuclease PolX, partial [bacterium]|nr:DNA polymerase/3'-5' exonuclease PolX [bacterium]
ALVETGEIEQLNEILKETPRTVLSIMRVPGVGPRKAAAIFKELGVATLDALRAACEAGEIQKLKGFGIKTEKEILKNIGMAKKADERIFWQKADEIAAELQAYINECPEVVKSELAGSYRRRKETVGDLDLLVDSTAADKVMDHFAKFARVEETIARGDTKMSVRFVGGLQADLRVVASEAFGAALQYFTGSKEHNVVLRKLAKERGLKINEYGVFRIEGDEETYIAGADEKEVYATLDLPVFAPELRENRFEFQWAEDDALPALIETADIRGDLHMHTTATDGRNELREMADAARDRGLAYIAITDHSQRVTMAGGLDPKRLRNQWAEIDALNDELGDSLRVFKGIECDILEKGGLDLPDDVLAEADWVLAAIHYGQRQPQSQIMDRLLEALEHPNVTSIAHPTGRLINQRPPYEVDIDALIQAAAAHNKMLEINANPRRLDLSDVYAAAAKRAGVQIVINTDAHHIDQLDNMRYGVLQARRAGLTKADVANTRTLKQFEKLLESI